MKNERLVSVKDADGVARPDVDMVLYYEDMDHGLRVLAERFGLDAETLINRYRGTKIHSEYRPRDVTGTVEHVIDQRSKELIDIVKAARFERLGYRRSTDNVVPIRRTVPDVARTTRAVG